MRKNLTRIVYAGDRDISVEILKFIIKDGIKPLALMLSDRQANNVARIKRMCGYLDSPLILEGKEFREKKGISLLTGLRPDYIICVHFPYIFPKKILGIPNKGVVNLHPAYLPYNRGYHTPTWSIWESTPCGVTLHFMDEGIDTGDIIYQKQINVRPHDTADTLYQRLKDLELEIFMKAWPLLLAGAFVHKKQSVDGGTTHQKKDIASIQEVDINKRVKAQDLIRRLRALTTNNIRESAYFKVVGKKYRMQLRLTEDDR